MTKIAYLDCPTGIAGDMCLGALIHAGVPLSYLTEQLHRLGLGDEFHLNAEKVIRNGQQATKARVQLHVQGAPEVWVAADGADLQPTFAQSHATSSPAADQGHYLPEDLTHDHLAHDHLAHDHGHNGQDSHAPNYHHIHEEHHESHHHSHHHSQHHSHHPHPEENPESHFQSHAHATRCLPDIQRLIRAAQLPVRVEAWSLAIFSHLAIAEAAVHGIPVDQVHFHEVGAIDAIVDIVGTCLGLDWLGIEQVYCAPLPTGGGTVWAAHGRLPVPAPAVLKLYELHQVPIYSNGIERELVTPTGAAIAVTLAKQFGPPPAMILQKVGLGAGDRDLPLPNILRLWIGETDPTASQAQAVPVAIPTTPVSLSPISQNEVTVLQTQVDDLSPQAIGYVFDTLFQAGAIDVFTQAIGMKKSRPGILLTVLCAPERASDCEAVIFQETSTLGIRRHDQQRRVLQREIRSLETKYGPVRVKVAWQEHPDQLLNVQPEYEDCASIARQQNLPWRVVHQQVLQTWYQQAKHGDQ